MTAGREARMSITGLGVIGCGAHACGRAEVAGSGMMTSETGERGASVAAQGGEEEALTMGGGRCFGGTSTLRSGFIRVLGNLEEGREQAAGWSGTIIGAATLYLQPSPSFRKKTISRALVITKHADPGKGPVDAAIEVQISALALCDTRRAQITWDFRR